MTVKDRQELEQRRAADEQARHELRLGDFTPTQELNRCSGGISAVN